MDEEMRKKMWNSIGVVVTKSTRENDHYNLLKMVIAKLEHPKLQVKNKSILLEMIKHIHNQNLVEPFRNAVIGNNPAPCDFPNRWTNQLGWEFFDLDQNEKKCGQKLTRMNFKEKF